MERDEQVNVFSRVRVHEPSARNTAGGGALFKELFEILQTIRDKGLSKADLHRLILDGKMLGSLSWESRKRVWQAIRYRYFLEKGDWLLSDMVDASKKGTNSPEILSLAYLYYGLRDRLTYEFVVGAIWNRWVNKATNIDRGDFLEFLEEKASEFPVIKQWREASRRKIATNTLSALRDFGLLRGAKIKHIQRPAVAPLTVHHLLCILYAEGLKGKELLTAPDWRLFLWSESETSEALMNLSRLGWIRFERSSSSVIIEPVRYPGERI